MTTATKEEFPVELATRLAKRIAKDQIGLFAAYRDISLADLEQIGMAGAAGDWQQFDPSKANASTFLYQSIWRDVQDAYRARARAARNEKQRVDDDTVTFDAADAPPSLLEDIEQWACDAEGEITIDWLRDVIRKAERAFPVRPKRGRGNPGYPIATYIGSIVIMKRLNLSTRGMVEYLEARKEFAKVLGFKYWVPQHNFFHECRNRIEAGFETVV